MHSMRASNPEHPKDPVSSNIESPLDDAHFIKTLRAQMLSFAHLQLSDETLAEDVVQEALMGALNNVGSFRRQAALKTWVFAILKNKLADVLRQRKRASDADRLLKSHESAENFDMLFDDRGHWLKEQRPTAWSHPVESLKNEQFWRVFDTCLSELPAPQARIFMMREFLELNSEEICDAATISMSNLHVILYRARIRLRECLDIRWFNAGEPPQ